MQLRILSGGTLLLAMFAAQQASAQFGPSTVVVSEVIERPVAPVQNFVAAVTPLRKSIVGTAVPGRVEQFLYDENDPETKLTYVRKGQALANLREGTVRIKVDEATAQRDLRQAELDEVQITHPKLVEQAQARLKAATEGYQFARNQYERNRRLYEQNRSISLEEMERSRAAAFTAEQDFRAADINLAIVEREDAILKAQARLAEAEAVLRELNDRVEKYTIRAPFDGFVVAEHTEVGEWVQEGDPIADVVQLHPVEVRAFVPEKYIAQLQVGGMAHVVPNLGGGAAERAATTGKVTGIVAEAVTRSRTFPVKIQVNNPDHMLKAGMLAEVTLEVGVRRPATLVPKDALVLGGRAPRIFLAVPDPDDPKKYVAKPMTVEQGASLGRWIAVTAVGDEIVAGDLVVEKGNERLRPGAPLALSTEGATPLPE